jgi:hypothetical protein
MLLNLWRCLVLRFVLVCEGRVNLAQPNPGAGFDDESLAVVHRQGFSSGLAITGLVVDARASGATCAVIAPLIN